MSLPDVDDWVEIATQKIGPRAFYVRSEDDEALHLTGAEVALVLGTGAAVQFLVGLLEPLASELGSAITESLLRLAKRSRENPPATPEAVAVSEEVRAELKRLVQGEIASQLERSASEAQALLAARRHVTLFLMGNGWPPEEAERDATTLTEAIAAALEE
jgi:hypothetical protein